uniref:EF-hand domain-containing protein n=1 Tax=Panagrolaimus sp. JU765 TaxID=591449 RepID=A0AC34Q893_9BILA
MKNVLFLISCIFVFKIVKSWNCPDPSLEEGIKFETIDVNGDGYLSDKEYEKYDKEYLAYKFCQMDCDRQGQLENSTAAPSSNETIDENDYRKYAKIYFADSEFRIADLNSDDYVNCSEFVYYNRYCADAKDAELFFNQTFAGKGITPEKWTDDYYASALAETLTKKKCGTVLDNLRYYGSGNDYVITKDEFYNNYPHIYYYKSKFKN